MASTSPPIFIVGPPRSGTSLLTATLSAHPNIFVANEAKLLTEVLGEGRGAFSADEVHRLLVSLAGSHLENERPLPQAAELLEDAPHITRVDFIERLLRHLAARSGKERWGEKTAVAYRNMSAIVNAFPDARYLTLDRSLAQIGRSYEKVVPHWGFAGGMMHWLDFRRQMAAHATRVDIMDVSFRRLTTEPEAALREVCEFVGEPFDAAMLKYFEMDHTAPLKTSKEFFRVAQPLDPTRSEDPDLSPLRARLVGWASRVGERVNAGSASKSPLEIGMRAALTLRAGWRRMLRPRDP